LSQSTFDDDDADDREDPDPSDQDDDGDEASVDELPCPFCRKPVYEGADVCPHCGNFITFGQPQSTRKRWVLLGIVLVLIAAIMGYVVFTVRGPSQ
jgi:hypothetical protein